MNEIPKPAPRELFISEMSQQTIFNRSKDFLKNNRGLSYLTAQENQVKRQKSIK